MNNKNVHNSKYDFEIGDTVIIKRYLMQMLRQKKKNYLHFIMNLAKLLTFCQIIGLRLWWIMKLN